MTARWPAVDKLVRAVNQRRDDPQPSPLIQVTVKTEMPCGKEFDRRARGRRDTEFRTKDNLHDAVKRDARLHLRDCKKDACVQFARRR